MSKTELAHHFGRGPNRERWHLVTVRGLVTLETTDKDGNVITIPLSADEVERMAADLRQAHEMAWGQWEVGR